MLEQRIRGRGEHPTASFGEPPAATAENPHPRPPMIPGSFVILVPGR